MDWQSVFLSDWTSMGRMLVVGVLAYTALVVFLRLSGKRTLAKLNAFDLVVTVALGSTLSAVILQNSISLIEGATALALLIAMQFLVAFTSVRWKAFAKAVRSEPTLLVRHGAFCRAAMRSERVTEAEAMSALRANGSQSISDVESMILESDGTISVVLASKP